MLDWESQATKVTLTDIEDQVLAMRRRLSEETASELAQAQVERMETVVPSNAATGKRLHTTDSERDRELIQRQIDATDGHIDALVYKLYGLSDDEIRIVEESSRRA